tara:strand:- start:12212 stop:12706 length:495 start_codon:yes stop_codon:yes gene_type:complete
MGYNPFRWYTQGKYRKRPLKSNAPLLLKIQNGDFEYSPFFREAKDNEKLYDKMYKEKYDSMYSSDEMSKHHESHQHAKMKRIKAQKLMEKGLEEELTRLNHLRKELTAEFGKDLWEKSLEKQRGKGTTEDLYWWYKKQVKMGQTPSEMAISLGRKTTKGLQPNI